MARIVHTVHRYKRPPKKRKPVPLKVPEVVTVRDRKRSDQSANLRLEPEATPNPAAAYKARIVTSRPRHGGEVEDLTPEELQRRGDAADELFRELVRRATGKP